MNYELRSLSFKDFCASLAGKERPVILLEGWREVAAEHEDVLVKTGSGS